MRISDWSSDVCSSDLGRRDWATETDPSTLALRLNNGDSRVAAGVQGRYSPRNPRSDLFGKIGRNTPIRVREDAAGDTYLVMPGFNDSYVSTPDIADLDDTTDIALRIDIEPTPRSEEQPSEI